MENKQLRASLKTPSEKNQLCTAYTVSSPLGVRKHAFNGFPCICCTYLFFLTQNGFLEMPLSFFDTENKYERLTKLGDPLERLNEIIDWEMFREKLTSVCQKEEYTKGGRPPIDVIIKFKASILKRLYNLSYDQTEYQINDRLTFMRFLGLGFGDKVLDSRTLWDFENTLAESETMDELFCMFDEMLESEGLITHKGTIVDATFVDAPKQYMQTVHIQVKK